MTFSQIPPASFTLVGTGDFRADGNTALVFQNRVDSGVVFWYTGGANRAVITGGDRVGRAVDAGWTLVGVADFNKDGRSDLLFQNQTTGQLVIWYMNGATYVGGGQSSATAGPDWKVVGVGDYNGDGYADLLFQNQTTNRSSVWYMNGTLYRGGSGLSVSLPADWQIVGLR